MAKSGSISASGTLWNARSQAANQGYSHLSGIEMMSASRGGASRRCAPLALGGRRGLGRVALQPAVARRSSRTASTRACRRAPGAAPRVRRHRRSAAAGGVERVGLGEPRGEDGVEVGEGVVVAGVRPRWRPEPQPHHVLRAGRDLDLAQHARTWCPMRAGLTASARPPTTWSLMPSLKWPGRGWPIEPVHVGLVVAEQQSRRRARPRAASPAATGAWRRPRRRTAPAAPAGGPRSPRPGVARPKLRQQRRASAASGPRLIALHPHQDVVGAGLGVLDEHVEVAALRRTRRCRAARIPAGPGRAARSPRPARSRGTPRAGTCRACGSRSGSACVEVVVELLDVLAVVALLVGQPEQPLLQDRVVAVPERQAQAPAQLALAEPGDRRPRPSDRRGCAHGRAGRRPGVAVGAVILPHRAPLAVAEVRPPRLPGTVRAVGQQTAALDGVEDRRRARRRVAQGARPATAAMRPRVPASASPFTVSGRQCRWKAASTMASGESRPPLAATS